MPEMLSVESWSGFYFVKISYCSFVLNITRVECRLGFQQNNLAFLSTDWAMFYATRDDDKFARRDILLPLIGVSDFHGKNALGDEKQLIFIFMVMPDKISLNLDQL